MAPELKPAYLIHGDDHGAVAERRAGLRALAEAQGAGASVEALEGEQATPAGVAAALAAMTLGFGARVIIVDGVERWREADVEQQLAPALAQIAPGTTIALFAREEQRAKAPAALHAAVKRAGGQVVEQSNVKPWELARWVRAQGERLGLSLDSAAASALVAQVGERQQRLLRELEKLALAGCDEVRIEDVQTLAAQSSESRAYALADALVAADARTASASYLRLRAQGERLPGLLYLMAKRVRDAVAVAAQLEAGVAVAKIKESLRPMGGRVADRFIADVRRSDSQRLRSALGTLADLELASRGGSPLPSARGAQSGLEEDTLVLRAIEAITTR